MTQSLAIRLAHRERVDRELERHFAIQRREFFRQLQTLQAGAQAFADLACDRLRVCGQRIERLIFIEPFRRRLRADFRNARNVVDRIADECQVVDDLFRKHIELRFHASAIQPRPGHGIHQRDPLVHELSHVLVAGGDQHVDVLIGGSFGERCDHVIGFHAFDAQQRQPHALYAFQQWLELRAQLVGHWLACRLVFLEQLVAERASGRIDDHCDQLRRFFLQQLLQHVEHAEYRARRLAPRIRQRRQCMKRAIQIGGPVDEDELASSVHAQLLSGGDVPRSESLAGAAGVGSLGGGAESRSSFCDCGAGNFGPDFLRSVVVLEFPGDACSGPGSVRYSGPFCPQAARSAISSNGAQRSECHDLCMAGSIANALAQPCQLCCDPRSAGRSSTATVRREIQTSLSRSSLMRISHT